MSDVDELRAKLRSLGYLDAGVDRFVLAPVQHGRGILALALRSSMRIGILAALLLGPSSAIGLAARLPGLITGPRDAVVIAAYLGVLFGAAAMAAAFVAAGLAAFLMRRGAADVRTATIAAAAAGALVTGACLVYLTLWWRAADPTGGSGGLWWTAFALSVAVGISLLLGRVVRTTAAAVIAATSRSAELPARRDRPWTVTLALGGAAFLGCAVLLFATAPGEGSAARQPPIGALAVVPTGLRVNVIGIDGFDPALFQRLVARGELPHLAPLLDGAVARLRIEPDRDPARVWTSLATGLSAAEHGIESLETRRVAGVQGALNTSQSPLVRAVSVATDLLRLSRPAAASGLERRAKTFWEVAADAGLRTAVVNWWATWPATAEGIVISDRAVLRLERGGDLDAEIAPADVYPRLHDEWPALKQRAVDRSQRAFVGESAEILATLRRSAELDALQVELALDDALGQPDLLTIYLPGLDIAQYALLASSDARSLSPSALAERVEALSQYYVYLDGLLTGLTAPNARTLTMMLTHPGRVSEGSDALLAIAGVGAGRATSIAARAADIAPTILYSLGVPASKDLRTPLTALFDPSFVARYPVRLVASYGRKEPMDVPRGGAGLDAEAIERLRSLGYVR